MRKILRFNSAYFFLAHAAINTIAIMIISTSTPTIKIRGRFLLTKLSSETTSSSSAISSGGIIVVEVDLGGVIITSGCVVVVVFGLTQSSITRSLLNSIGFSVPSG